MTARRTSVAPAAALTRGLDALRAEAGVPRSFSPEAEAEAAAASAQPPQGERVGLPFVTIDPPGSRDLDQALHIARRGSGHRVSYADVPPELAPLLREVGERRLALQVARGGVQLDVPEQEVVQDDGGWTTRFRVIEPSEEHNAQVSLLTGMAAAQLMLRGGTGVLRTQPDPDPKALARLRLQAVALGEPWPEDEPYAAFIASLDAAIPAHAALLREATGVGRGAGYTAFDGTPPAERTHFALAAEYAHATAPLRRLQDRYVSECCLAAHAGTPVPDWVRAALPGLPAEMAAATRRANAVERGVLDLAEALLLTGREGETFAGVVVDDDLVQLAEPAVRAKLPGAPAPGSAVTVRLERADAATRTVTFALA